MIENQTTRVWVNRIFAFALGGFAIFVVMSVFVVSSVRSQNEALEAELYKPTGLLADAGGFFQNNDFDRAAAKLDVLMEQHPGSAEAAEGRNMLTAIELAVQREQALQAEMDVKWEAAAAAVREVWAATTAETLRSEFEEARLKLLAEGEALERDMTDSLAKEWELVKAKVRSEWESQG